MTFLLVLAPVAMAQKRPKPPVNAAPPGESAGNMATVNNRGLLPDTQGQRNDTCLLPPLDLARSTAISTAQLQIPTKAKREYERACSALMKKKPSNAERHLRRAVQEYPKYFAAWVTLGQVLADENRFEDARNACSQATAVDRIYLPAHLCLAEIASRTHEWSEELQYSSHTLELDPSSGLAYEYHAAANANLGNLAVAERSGLRAIELNKDRHEPGVYFLLAQIYKLEGDTTREEEQFRQFLKYTHNPERAALAKQILARLDNGQSEVIEIQESNTSQDTRGLSAQRWEPKDIDEAVPPVLRDTPCPLSQILQETSQRATELVENLQRFAATEQIEHTELRKNGKPRKSTSELFSYVAEVEQNSHEGFWIEEYRTTKRPTDPPTLEDTGTAALALIFHPKVIGNLEVQCEGRTSLQETPAWQLRFEEGPDPSKSFSAFRIKDSEYRVRLKGRAWISADTYQVLRLQTDLAAPIPEINLQVKHSDVAYAAVQSARQEFRLWLPQSAMMRISYRGRRYQRMHNFSHLELFLVDTQQRVKEPLPSTEKSEFKSN